MDKIDATLLLAKELAASGHITIDSEMTLDFYTKKAKSAVAVNCDGNTLLGTDNYSEKIDQLVKSRGEKEKKLAQSLGANYLFCRRMQTCGGEYAHVAITSQATPFAIIGELEEKILCEKFYRDVSAEVEKAMDLLGITHFVDAYRLYSKGDYPEERLKAMDAKQEKPAAAITNDASLAAKIKLVEKYKAIFSSIRNNWRSMSDEDRFNVFTQGNKYGPELHAELAAMGIGKEILAAKNVGAETTKDLFNVERLVLMQDELIQQKLKSGPSFQEQVRFASYCADRRFIDFVFSLPEDEQNVTGNKKMIAAAQDKHKDLIESIVLGAYQAHPGRFTDYFGSLNDSNKKIMVGKISALEKQDPHLNSALYDAGFTEVRLNHLDLYRSNKDGFKKCFEQAAKKDTEFAKRILDDLLDPKKIADEEIDADISKWLSEKYQKLMEGRGVHSVGK